MNVEASGCCVVAAGLREQREPDATEVKVLYSQSAFLTLHFFNYYLDK